MPKSKMHPIQPAPAPLPEDVEELLLRAQEGPYPGDAANVLLAHISDLTRRLAEVEAELAASKQNERRWIAKGEEAIAERNAANKALEAIKRHQEIVAGTGTAQMSTTWKIANDYLRSRGAALAATEAE